MMGFKSSQWWTRVLTTLALALVLFGSDERGVCSAQWVHKDIVSEDYFANTMYFQAVEAFFDGMDWPTKYDNSEACFLTFSAFLNDFHFMYNNHTTATN
mmetsp:Transcript_16610/g.28296  ORF Transcript_16610/g.28296 Transcript_16610/m.28296 type:complete len:99 (-) Transcript_16610:1177-1473(-)